MVINPSQFPNFAIPEAKVLIRLGYARGKTALDETTHRIIREEIATAQKLIVPHQVIAFADILRAAPTTIKLDPGLTIESADIFKLLADCTIAYGFAVTIGPNLEEKRNRYVKEKETTRALILDAAGSVAAEELAEITHKSIETEAAERGQQVTRRFSPGYGDWPVSTHNDFLKWLGADAIGIKATESGQLIPEKSVSAILGLTTRSGNVYL